MNRFLGLSGVVHIGLIAGVLFIGAKNDFSPHKVIESLSFEAFGGDAAGEKAELKAANDGADTTSAAPTETVAAKEPKIEKSAAVAKAAPVKALPAKAKAASKTSKTKSTESAKQALLKDVPTNEASDVVLDESVVDEAISEVKKSEKPVEKEESEVTAVTAIPEKIQEPTQDQTDIEAQQEAEATKAKKVALLADLKKQNAEREAKEAAAAAAVASSAATEEKSTGATSGLGSSDKGEGPQEGETVHALAEFKQVGGNPKPQYDNDDRLKNRSGTVTFQAMVQKDGSLKEFQLLESSGHRSLDAKTLQALKKWKFAAGQEGWIEIPFKWDLKGGAQEVSGLRTTLPNSRNAVTK